MKKVSLPRGMISVFAGTQDNLFVLSWAGVTIYLDRFILFYLTWVGCAIVIHLCPLGVVHCEEAFSLKEVALIPGPNTTQGQNSHILSSSKIIELLPFCLTKGLRVLKIEIT